MRKMTASRCRDAPSLPRTIADADRRCSHHQMLKRLSIIVVEKDRDRAKTIVDGLTEAGDLDVLVIGDDIGLARRIAERNPDLVLIDAGNPSRDALEELTLASAPMQRPVAMFVDESDGALTRAAIEAGVSAYVVAGLAANRIRPVLDAAIARFHMMQKMRVELAETRRALEERKVIDRAKGIVMRAKGIGEDEAYALMRKAAMDQGKKLGDVAQALVTAAELLK
jgi:two-component system, response regulator / RNA-binding antiterminator